MVTSARHLLEILEPFVKKSRHMTEADVEVGDGTTKSPPEEVPVAQVAMAVHHEVAVMTMITKRNMIAEAVVVEHEMEVVGMTEADLPEVVAEEVSIATTTMTAEEVVEDRASIETERETETTTQKTVEAVMMTTMIEEPVVNEISEIETLVDEVVVKMTTTTMTMITITTIAAVVVVPGTVVTMIAMIGTVQVEEERVQQRVESGRNYHISKVVN